MLTEEKALTFRGFGITPDTHGRIADALLPRRLAYMHGNSPRTKVGENVYTSTEYPAELTISMHNEMSYSHTWPSRLLFYCVQAPITGGATPVVDGEAWLAALHPNIQGDFATGVRYTQNLHNGYGLGKSWQDTFETDDRTVVERFLADSKADWKWKNDGTLWISQLRPATTRHPVTGTEVWFNQADQFHISGLGEQADDIADLLPEADMPQSVSFADGSPIPAEHIRHIQETGLALAIDVDWEPGDLLLIDNVLVAHGRRPFTGHRRILVAMSD
ncbi:TauD/TfdA family dioxygenase [Streptomyces wuyuanensis]|uniref:TauD/TfdA family dioxygenase n=1 Tax=Streptomyces wuyuanensis TaxID=1196353 RepID=UPI00370F89BE